MILRHVRQPAATHVQADHRPFAGLSLTVSWRRHHSSCDAPYLTPLPSAGTLPPLSMQKSVAQTCSGQHAEVRGFLKVRKVRTKRQPVMFDVEATFRR